MKRILFLDKKSNEIENILNGKKNIVMRAANIKKYPYKMIEEGYRLFFKNNNTEDIVLASATASKVECIEVSKEESNNILDKMKDELLLTKKNLDYMRNKKYFTIITLSDIKQEYATTDTSLYGKVDDWVIINDIKE